MTNFSIRNGTLQMNAMSVARLFVLMCALTSATAYAQTPLDSIKANYHLLFEDNFDYDVPVGADGFELSLPSAIATSGTIAGRRFTDVWSMNDDGWGKSTHYIPQNVQMTARGRLGLVEHTCIPMSVRIGDDVKYYDHEGGKLTGQEPYRFKYGIIEASLKMPEDHAAAYRAEGAFWTLPQAPPVKTELDMCDLGFYSQVEQGVVDWYDGTHANKVIKVSADTPFAGIKSFDRDFHVFSCVWTAEEAAFFIDGYPSFTVPYTQVKTYAQQGNLLQLAVIAWGNSDAIDAYTEDGFRLEIDWVRVWETNSPIKD